MLLVAQFHKHTYTLAYTHLYIVMHVMSMVKLCCMDSLVSDIYCHGNVSLCMVVSLYHVLMCI